MSADPASDPSRRATSPGLADHRVERAAAYPASDPRLVPLRADLARWLRPVLAAAGVAYPAAAFDALVLDMARVALHWSVAEVDRRGRTPPLGRPAVPVPPA